MWYTIYSYGSRAISAVVALRVRYPWVIFNVASYLVSAFRVKASLIAQTTQTYIPCKWVYCADYARSNKKLHKEHNSSRIMLIYMK